MISVEITESKGALCNVCASSISFSYPDLAGIRIFSGNTEVCGSERGDCTRVHSPGLSGNRLSE